jgi:hypothetical protein
VAAAVTLSEVMHRVRDGAGSPRSTLVGLPHYIPHASPRCALGGFSLPEGPALSSPRPRGSRTYAKPALTEDALAERLRERGLHIADDDRCRRYLRHIGYYRLSPYTIPFQVRGQNHAFRAGADFDAVLDLYVFDRKLRLLVLDALERIEVALRSSLTDHMSLAHGGPHWYVDSTHFGNATKHGKLLDLVDERLRAQRRRVAESASRSELSYPSALEHYVTTYGEPARPPSWLMVEELTLGQLTSLFTNLASPGRSQCDRQDAWDQRTADAVVAGHVRPCPQHLCAPRAPVERRPRLVSGPSDVASGAMARATSGPQ